MVLIYKEIYLSIRHVLFTGVILHLVYMHIELLKFVVDDKISKLKVIVIVV